jgi:pre-mRNA-splicing factor SYF1
MERRLLLLNSVSLRQNPHNVLDWHKRIELYEDQPHEVIFLVLIFLIGVF